uniref:Uncharacterized protein n=1 Tax=Arundo donax TaxID=35708 RepID=A0A0A9GDU5_ARUDO
MQTKDHTPQHMSLANFSYHLSINYRVAENIVF